MMKKICLIMLGIALVGTSYGQTTITIKDSNGTKTFTSDTSKACDKNLIFSIVGTMPAYQGGLKRLEQQMNTDIEVPKDIKGKVTMRFVVNCNDIAYGVQFINELDNSLEPKLVEFLKKNQNWTAGKHRGEYVDCDVFLGLKVKKGKIKVLNK